MTDRGLPERVVNVQARALAVIGELSARSRTRRSLVHFDPWGSQPNLHSTAREVPSKTAVKCGNCCPREPTAEAFMRWFFRTRNHSCFAPGNAKVILLFNTFDPHLAGGIYQSSIFERVCRELVKEQSNVRNRAAPELNVRAGYDNSGFRRPLVMIRLV